MSIQRRELLEFLEEYAPRDLAESYDNVGMLIDCGTDCFSKILLALDLTTDVAQEAADIGADLILTHHPIFFQGIKRIDIHEHECRAAITLIKNNICHFVAHTNLDSCKDGVNVRLCELLELQNHHSILPVGADDSIGLARMGMLKSSVSLQQFCKQVKIALGTHHLRVIGLTEREILRVAVSSGAGMSSMHSAINAGADVLLTGEVKYNEALDAAACDLAIIDAGHYETERPALDKLFDGLQYRFDNVKYNVEFILSKVQHSVIQII